MMIQAGWKSAAVTSSRAAADQCVSSTSDAPSATLNDSDNCCATATSEVARLM